MPLGWRDVMINVAIAGDNPHICEIQVTSLFMCVCVCVCFLVLSISMHFICIHIRVRALLLKVLFMCLILYIQGGAQHHADGKERDAW